MVLSRTSFLPLAHTFLPVLGSLLSCYSLPVEREQLHIKSLSRPVHCEVATLAPPPLVEEETCSLRLDSCTARENQSHLSELSIGFYHFQASPN